MFPQDNSLRSQENVMFPKIIASDHKRILCSLNIIAFDHKRML